MLTNRFSSRRGLLKTVAGSGWLALTSRYAAAADFWNKKDSGEWSPQEIDTLKTKSPWAKKVHGEIAGGGGSRGGGSGGGSRGGGGSAGSFGGMADAESNGISAGGGGSRGGGGGKNGGGGSSDGGGFSAVPQGPEVVIRWESAAPMLAATKFQLPPNLANHYAVSITGLPPQMLAMVMNGRPGGGGGRGRGRDGKAPDAPPAEAPPVEAGTPEEQAKARQERLLHSVTLTAKGRDPQVADTVMQTSDKQTIIFGFSKDALPLGANDKDVEFAMKTGIMTIKAKFEPKEMMFKGALTV
jgi:hypothetical protein